MSTDPGPAPQAANPLSGFFLWDGTQTRPLTLSGVWDGSKVQPLSIAGVEVVPPSARSADTSGEAG